MLRGDCVGSPASTESITLCLYPSDEPHQSQKLALQHQSMLKYYTPTCPCYSGATTDTLVQSAYGEVREQTNKKTCLELTKR